MSHLSVKPSKGHVHLRVRGWPTHTTNGHPLDDEELVAQFQVKWPTAPAEIVNLGELSACDGDQFKVITEFDGETYFRHRFCAGGQCAAWQPWISHNVNTRPPVAPPKPHAAILRMESGVATVKVWWDIYSVDDDQGNKLNSTSAMQVWGLEPGEDTVEGYVLKGSAGHPAHSTTVQFNKPGKTRIRLVQVGDCDIVSQASDFLCIHIRDSEPDGGGDIELIGDCFVSRHDGS